MNEIIYIKSLHRPYNQNLNSVKWVCKFIENKNSNGEISKSDLYVEFYIYFLKKFYGLYIKSSEGYLTHGIPTFESIQNSYLHLKGLDKDKKKERINEALANRTNSIERSIFSTYKASSYFLNLAKTKLKFVDHNNKLTENGVALNGFKSNDLILSQKEREILFTAILNNDFHFFISLSLLKKIQKKVKNLDLEELHYEFLLDKIKIRHFDFTENSKLNFSKVRDYWIKDLQILDNSYNIRKVFLNFINNGGFQTEYKEIQNLVNDYYKEKIVSKSRYQKRLELFEEIYVESKKNELGFLSLNDIADKMKLNKKMFQIFIMEFYESEKRTYNIFFNNIVQSTSIKNQFLIRNRPVVNIKIKELNK